MGEVMLDPLFQPITINRMEIKNRIFMPAMHLNMAGNYAVSDRLVDFYALPKPRNVSSKPVLTLLRSSPAPAI
jgi:hypothetical protein